MIDIEKVAKMELSAPVSVTEILDGIPERISNDIIILPMSDAFYLVPFFSFSRNIQ